MWLLDGIKRRISSAGYSSLAEAERGYFATIMMVADVCNGGFHQYFHNYTGDYANDALLMLERIGDPLAELRDILERAMKMFPHPYPIDNAQRQELLAVMSAEKLAELEAMETTVFDYATDVEVELDEWALEHGDAFHL